MSSFRKPHVITRYAPGALVDGRWQRGAASTVNITASVQPARGKELEKLPDGRRTGSIYKIFTDVPLNVLDEATKINGDTMTLFGDVYEVTLRADWQNNVINHYAYLLTKAQAITPANVG